MEATDDLSEGLIGGEGVETAFYGLEARFEIDSSDYLVNFAIVSLGSG